MFKKLSISLTAIVFALALTCTSFGAFAMGPSEDGVYEVPIEMWHAEKERTSMGDSYIVHTALLTVDGDEKTLTIAPAKTTSDMHFWYYKDGSVEGDTVEVEQKNNVEIDGTEYETAFEFPIKSDNEFVGVKFAASAMPLSPSARIKIDYDSAKKNQRCKKRNNHQKNHYHYNDTDNNKYYNDSNKYYNDNYNYNYNNYYNYNSTNRYRA